MNFDVNLLVTVVLVLCMGTEGAVAWWKGRPVYRLADTVSHIAAGLAQLALQATFGLSLLGLYTGMLAYSPVTWDATSPVTWVVGYVVLEFFVYWRHRAGHEVSLVWAIHEVHHQSSEFNLAVAQRVSMLQWLQTTVFVLPVALLGLPAPVFGALFGLIHFYNFLLHTQLIGRLGRLEWWIQTPALHRVHHGRNAHYIDKNYGFTLTLFDHLFGTYQPEVEPVAFGTTVDLPSLSVAHNNLSPFRRLARRVRDAPSPWSALQVVIRHPAWVAQTGTFAFPTDRTPGPRAAPSTTSQPGRQGAAVVLLLVAATVTLSLAGQAAQLPSSSRLAASLLALLTLTLCTQLAMGPPEAR